MFLMNFENSEEFLALFSLDVVYVFKMDATYFDKLYNGVPLYETIGLIGVPSLWILGSP